MASAPFSVVALNKRDTVRQAQTLIRMILPSVGIVVDGILGTNTRKAYSQLNDESRLLVDSLVRSRNPEMLTLFSDSDAAGPQASSTWYTIRELEPYLDSACERFDIDRSVLDFFLTLEPIRRVRNGVVEYNAASKHGSYRGLMQMGEPAWIDAQRFEQSTSGTGPLNGVSYQDGAFDPELSIHAAAAYAKFSRVFARGRGFEGPYSKEFYYAMHNQGPSFLTYALRGKKPPYYANQSTSARRVLDAALSTLKPGSNIA